MTALASRLGLQTPMGKVALRRGAVTVTPILGQSKEAIVDEVVDDPHSRIGRIKKILAKGGQGSRDPDQGAPPDRHQVSAIGYCRR